MSSYDVYLCIVGALLIFMHFYNRYLEDKLLRYYTSIELLKAFADAIGNDISCARYDVENQTRCEESITHAEYSFNLLLRELRKL